ncbi:hypothetical protein D3C87_1977290 [compost metagenome]
MKAKNTVVKINRNAKGTVRKNRICRKNASTWINHAGSTNRTSVARKPESASSVTKPDSSSRSDPKISMDASAPGRK